MCLYYNVIQQLISYFKFEIALIAGDTRAIAKSNTFYIVNIQSYFVSRINPLLD